MSEIVRAFSVTSSAFYWPFPFADGEPSSFVHDSQKAGQEDTFLFTAAGSECRMDYQAFNFTQEDNFCRLDVDNQQQRLSVTAFGQQGEVLRTGGWFSRGDGRELIAELELAPW